MALRKRFRTESPRFSDYRYMSTNLPRTDDCHSRVKEMSTKKLKRTLELLVRKPIRRAGLQDAAEREVLHELERRKAA